MKNLEKVQDFLRIQGELTDLDHERSNIISYQVQTHLLVLQGSELKFGEDNSKELAKDLEALDKRTLEVREQLHLLLND